MVDDTWDGAVVTTVGIPTMNNSKTIKCSIKQLQNQTRLPDRVIIVDNSTDATPDIISEMATDTDFAIDLYDQPECGRGVGAARAKIYRKFHEDLLLCLDTNHSVDETWVETHVEFHQAHPSYGVLSNSSIDGFDDSVSDPLQSEYFGQSNCSIKKSALESVDGWDCWFHRGEDWDMRIRLWMAGVDSWAKNSINAERFERNAATEINSWFWTKTLYDPSSITYLRKYGRWYLRFHTLHVAGDLASLAAIALLAVTPVGLLMTPLLGLMMFGTALVPAAGFIYYKGPRKQNKIIPLPRQLGAFIVFYALGLSALNSLQNICSGEEWNYSGFDK
jgi:glycosyltransferase involved in cell wall biosynthesis